MEMWSICLLFMVSLIVIRAIHWFYKWSNPRCDGKLPPGSMGFPLVGETIQFIIPSKSLDMPTFIKKRLSKYGPLFRTSLMGKSVIISSDPEFNHYLLRQEGKLVVPWMMDSFSKLLKHDPREIYPSNESIHKYQRNLVLDLFGLETIKEKLMPQIETVVRQRLKDWSKQPSIEAKGVCSAMLFDFSAKIMFSYDPKRYGENLGESLSNMLQGFMSIPLNIPGTAFHKCVKAQRTAIRVITELLNERRSQYPQIRKKDYMDRIVEDLDRGYFWSEKLAIYSIFGLTLASFEGISSTLALAIKFLTENPSIVEKMRVENEAILKDREEKDSGLTWKEYKSMIYTRHVVNEASRLASVAPGILRKAITDIHVDGYTIPKDWLVVVIPASVLLNPNIYENPIKFDPSRWENMSSSSIIKNFIPFGGGSRSCAGAEFSKVFMAIFLHVLVTEYRWTKIKEGDLFRLPALSFGDGFHIKLTQKQV